MERIEPIGPDTEGPTGVFAVTPVPAARRRSDDGDGRRRERGPERRDPPPQRPPGPDADGHVDLTV